MTLKYSPFFEYKNYTHIILHIAGFFWQKNGKKTVQRALFYAKRRRLKFLGLKIGVTPFFDYSLPFFVFLGFEMPMGNVLGCLQATR